MPTTPVYALRYPASSDPADVPTDMGELATDVEAKLLLGGVTYSTTPPATPVDGQLWCLPADTTNGIMWMFRYRSASSSTYKWEFVGGPPWEANIASQESTTSTVLTDLATVGPSLTIPRSGDYLVNIWARTTETAGNLSILGVKVGAAAAGDVAYLATSGVGGVLLDSTVSGKTTINPTAGDLVKMQYRVTAGPAATFSLRWLSVLPRRVS